MAKRTPKRTSRKYRNRQQKTKKKILRKKSRKTKRTSRKNLRKQSRKSLRKQSRKSLRKQYKNNKNILFGGMMGSPGGGGAAAVDPQKFTYYEELLLHGPWYPGDRITTFLNKHLNFDGASPVEILDKKKEVRTASFTNYYRDNIYHLVSMIDTYLGDLADVVVSGGDGLNNNLDLENRLISPDIDVKVIIKHISVRGNDWLNFSKTLSHPFKDPIKSAKIKLNGQYLIASRTKLKPRQMGHD